MALVRCDFFSDVLGVGTSLVAVLPQRTSAQIGVGSTAPVGPAPVLYLLHGLSDDATAWTRRTSIERYAGELGLAVVMPQVSRSFYADEVHGHPYWTFLTRELPEVVAGFFAVSSRREDTFVAGLSMGGYGALKWALRHPERFAAAASLSGALDVGRGWAERLEGPDGGVVRRVLGDRDPTGSDDDVLELVHRAGAAGADLPALYACCGTGDPLHPESLALRDACAAAGVPLTYDDGPGDHDWAYWDARIRDVLGWLPLARPALSPATSAGRRPAPAPRPPRPPA